MNVYCALLPGEPDLRREVEEVEKNVVAAMREIRWAVDNRLWTAARISAELLSSEVQTLVAALRLAEYRRDQVEKGMMELEAVGK